MFGSTRAPQAGLGEKTIGIRGESLIQSAHRGRNEEYWYAYPKTTAFEETDQHPPRARFFDQARDRGMSALPRNEAAAPGVSALQLLQGPRGARQVRLTDSAAAFPRFFRHCRSNFHDQHCCGRHW